MNYTLTWITTAGRQSRQFESWDDAEAFAEATLIDANGITGPIVPNHPELEQCDDRLYHGANKYAGITRNN